jgi:hypothetical protein
MLALPFAFLLPARCHPPFRHSHACICIHFPTSRVQSPAIPAIPDDLAASAPRDVVDECERAFALDVAGSYADALKSYLNATDVLLNHIRTLAKGDPHTKPLKKFARFLLMRADHLKHTK